jgi:endonuclease III
VVNKQLLENKGDKNDIKILLILISNLLMRSMLGERGSRLDKELSKYINSKNDLNDKVFKTILTEAQYRWTNDGVQVMSDTVNYFEQLNWDWVKYFKMAQDNYENNFIQDSLLKIKHIKYKVRDLAISNFNENYIANDIHIVRVSTRLGLLNYGFDLLSDTSLEMGNNPGNDKNYFFLHRLFLKLSKMTNRKYTLADMDRMFWQFGRTICNSEPRCKECPLNKLCLTGQNN